MSAAVRDSSTLQCEQLVSVRSASAWARPRQLANSECSSEGCGAALHEPHTWRDILQQTSLTLLEIEICSLYGCSFFAASAMTMLSCQRKATGEKRRVNCEAPLIHCRGYSRWRVEASFSSSESARRCVFTLKESKSD